jgi:hypothetical protein
MGTSKYLDSVLRILPAIQARQISDLLQKLQTSGQIKNTAEYQDRLRDLATAINSSTPKPSFERIRAIVWNLCNSDLQNTMLQAAKNDIEALFIQMDEIGEKLSDHNVLFMEGIVADLNKTINEQEETILRLEWIKNSNNEFTTAISNTFSSSTLGRTDRSELIASSLYFDNRLQIGKPKEELPDALVSEKGSKLLLNSTEDTIVIPITAKEHTNPLTYNTEVSVDINTDINNIIDGQRGTFWTKNIYLSSAVPKVSTIIELNLGSSKDINYMIIETGIAEPFLLEEIIGITYDGSKVDLLNGTVSITGTERVDFPKNNISSVLLTISTSTYRKAEYHLPAENIVHDAVDNSNRYSKLMRRQAIEPAAIKALNSNNISKIVGNESPFEKRINSFLYSIVIDNIWFGNSEYNNTSIFVSKSLKINNLGVLGLSTIEKVETGNIRNTIEFDVVKIDRFPKYNEQRFPILPIGGTTIPCERLILTKKSNISNYTNTVGVLRFCPHVKSDWEIGDSNPFNVYKNGILIDLGGSNGWEFAIDKVGNEPDWKVNYLDAITLTDYAYSPPKMLIRIKSPEESAVYSVSYTARTSDAYSADTKLYLDSEQLIWMDREGKIYFAQENPNIDVQSEVYLQITMRRNLPAVGSSPELDSYVLLGASYTR